MGEDCGTGGGLRSPSAFLVLDVMVFVWPVKQIMGF